jgi:hypothetical protein
VGRLEDNRVFHIAQERVHENQVWQLQERVAAQEAMLRRLLESSAFSVAERLSKLRKRAGVGPNQRAVTKAEVERLLKS